MIECQYCYTRNKDAAPKCESCGAPFGDGNEKEDIESDYDVIYPDPNRLGSFIKVRTIRMTGKTAKEFARSIPDLHLIL